jgi:hypothetical protein
MSVVLKYINLFGGVAFSGAAFVIGLNELYSNETLPAGPDSIILVAVILAAFALSVTSIIAVIGEFQAGEDVVSKDLLKQTMGFHHRMSGRLVLLTGLFAGISLSGKAAECGDGKDEPCDGLYQGTWSIAEGLFLGSLIYKGIDAGVDAFATIVAGDEGYEPLTNVSVADKMSRDFVGFTALLISFILFMVNHGLDEVFDKYTTDGSTGVPTFKNTSFMEEAGKVDKPLLNWAMILSIIALASILILVGLAANAKNFILAAVGSLSSAVAHVVSGLLAIHVGKYLHQPAYDTADGDFLPSNFFYFGAAILAAYAAANFDSKDIIEDDEDKTATKGTVRDASLFAVTAGSFALWAAQTLYSNVSYVGEVNATKADGTIVKVDAPVVSKARELGMYAMVLVVYLTFHGFAVKLFETLIKTGGSFVGLFGGVKSSEDDRFSTLRAEQSITFALASAVLWGCKAQQGDAPALDDGTLVSLWLLFFVSAGGRTLSWLNVLSEGGVTTFSKLFMNDNITRIFSNQKVKVGPDGDVNMVDGPGGSSVTIPCLGAVISLFLSFASYSVYFFAGSGEDGWKFFGDDYMGTFQGLSWILVLAHVVLTIFGMIPNVKIGNAGALHAGWIPILRFGVSSIAIWTFGMAAGQEILNGADEQYAFPAFALYLTYDILSKGKF